MLASVNWERISAQGYLVPAEGFTQAVKVEISETTTLVFVSGLTARDADGNIVAIGDAEGQTRQIFENLRLILESAGGALEQVCRLANYLTDMRHHAAMHRARLEAFRGVLPPSTSVEVSRLYDERQLVEIEATAIVPRAGSNVHGG